MLNDFPSKHGPDREKLILDIVDNQQDRLSYSWYPLNVEQDGHMATFYVMDDALKIDGVRVNVTADTEQRIADRWGAMLLTAKLSDLIWHHAEVRLEPCPRKITSSTKGMIEHSLDVDDQLNHDPEGKLISTVGKNWIIDEKLANKKGMACNHGWHFKGNSFQGIKGNVNPSLLKNPDTKTYWRLIQSLGTAHDFNNHTDYSQICRLVTRECIVDEETRDLVEILKDPELAKLASHTGPLSVFRQPGVPEPNTVFVSP